MSSSQSLKIGIVGFGTFGQFLANTMIKQGHTLTATSRSDYSKLCLQMGIRFFRDITSFLDADMDVILLCTSISSLSEVVGSMPLNCLKRPTLFVDVLSVKEHPKNLLLRVLREESDILCSKFLQIFASEGCKMVEMSCEEHDKAAAKSQFITHTIGRALAEMDVKPTPIDTKGFQALVQLKEPVMGCSFDLYSGLFMHNRFARQELENLEHALHKVKEMLVQRMNEGQSPERTES